MLQTDGVFSDNCVDACRQALESLRAHDATPGVQYVFADRTRRFEHVSGYAHLEPDEALDPTTTLNAYSVAKVLTACAVVEAARQGKMDLDAPIESLLDTREPRGFGSVRQTLLHRAGFPNPLPLNWVHVDTAHAQFDQTAFAHQIASSLRRPRRAGNRYQYSNIGYLMLGEALKRATGHPLERFVAEHLLSSVQLLPGEYLGYSIPDGRRHARGYLRRLSVLNLALSLATHRDRLIERHSGRWVEFRLHHVDGAAYGGLIANARGLARLGIAFLDADVVGSATLRDALFTPVPGPGPNRSLAWFCRDLLGCRFFAHAGGGPAYYCELRVYPERGAVSAIMLNRPGLRDMRLLDRIDPALLSD
jgi:D-alanyl-D-alanine carboxypeptidase